jgi:hypothetical protein
VSELQETQPTEGHREPTHNSTAFLSQADLGYILRLHAEGLPQTAIAARLGRTQAAISKALKRLGTDSTALATHHFKARSYKVARKVTHVAETGKDADSVKAAKVVLEAAGVISSMNSSIQLGIQVIIGGESQPAIGAGSVQVEALETTVEQVVLPRPIDAS